MLIIIIASYEYMTVYKALLTLLIPCRHAPEKLLRCRTKNIRKLAIKYITYFWVIISSSGK